MKRIIPHIGIRRELQAAFALIILLLILWGIFGTHKVPPQISPEVKFSDASLHGMQIVPASCPSTPDFTGQCDTTTPPPTNDCAMELSPWSTTYGPPATLSWDWNGTGYVSGTLTAADQFTGVSSNMGSIAQSGLFPVTPQHSTKYTINGQWSGGTFECDATITVNPVPPAAPAISGSKTPTTNISNNYSLVSTDPQGDTVRYGVDWDDNGTVDQWFPASGYVPSGQSTPAPYSWSTTGAKTFEVQAQNSQGLTSGWTSYTVAPTNQLQCDGTPQTYSTPGTFTLAVPAAYGSITVTVNGPGGGGGGGSLWGGLDPGNAGNAGNPDSSFDSSLVGGGGGGGGGGTGSNYYYSGTPINGSDGSPGAASGGNPSTSGAGASGGLGGAGYTYSGYQFGGNGGVGGVGGQSILSYTSSTLAPGSVATIVVGSGGAGGAAGYPGYSYPGSPGSDGSVSITCTPSVLIPPPVCTPAYSCSGQTIQHTDSSCDVTNGPTCVSPAFCSPGSATCVNPAVDVIGHLQAAPSLLVAGSPSKLFWNVQNVSSCSISGSDGEKFINLPGADSVGLETRNISQQTTFTLSCAGLDGSTLNDTPPAVVNVVPIFQEH